MPRSRSNVVAAEAVAHLRDWHGARAHDASLRALAAARLRPCGAMRSMRGRLGHALLFCGPAAAGQARGGRTPGAAAAVHGDAATAAIPAASAAAASCSRPARIRTSTCVSFVPNKEGTRLRTEIVIEQIRAAVREALADAAVRRRAGGDHRSGRRDQPRGLQRAAEDAGRTAAGPLPVAGQRQPRAPAGDDPQPLPAPGIPSAAARRKRWPGCASRAMPRPRDRSARRRARPSGPGRCLAARRRPGTAPRGCGRPGQARARRRSRWSKPRSAGSADDSADAAPATCRRPGCAPRRPA